MDMEFLAAHVWPRLDRYKEAVIARKSSAELDSLRVELMKEIGEVPSVPEGTKTYFDSQCESVEQRHLTDEELKKMKRGPYRTRH